MLCNSCTNDPATCVYQYTITWVAIGKHSAKFVEGIFLSTIAEASVHHYVCLSVDTFVYVFRRGITASASGGGIIIDW